MMGEVRSTSMVLYTSKVSGALTNCLITTAVMRKNKLVGSPVFTLNTKGE